MNNLLEAFYSVISESRKNNSNIDNDYSRILEPTDDERSDGTDNDEFDNESKSFASSVFDDESEDDAVPEDEGPEEYEEDETNPDDISMLDSDTIEKKYIGTLVMYQDPGAGVDDPILAKITGVANNGAIMIQPGTTGDDGNFVPSDFEPEIATPPDKIEFLEMNNEDSAKLNQSREVATDPDFFDQLESPAPTNPQDLDIHESLESIVMSVYTEKQQQNVIQENCECGDQKCDGECKNKPCQSPKKLHRTFMKRPNTIKEKIEKSVSEGFCF